MKDEKELHEINEEELEQISGGASGDIKYHLRCPVCGKEEWMSFIGGRKIPCTFCAINTGESVKMELV